MLFSDSYLSDKMFRNQMMTFDRLSAVQTEDGTKIRTGAFPQPNGDVLIRLYLPHASAVTAEASVSRKVFQKIDLLHDNGMPAGVFEGVLLYDERLTGNANINVTIDGHYELIPDLPLIWTANRPYNAVEIPDPEGDYLQVKDVPHGTLTRNIFYAHSMHNWENCYVYTPPGYMNSDMECPVLYLLHGGGDNELCWEYVGHVSHIMDNLIADGKAVPFLIVMCNDQLRYGGHVMGTMDRAFEHMLLDDVIPYIEETYRVHTGKWNRAIAGLSMGSFMTSDIGFGNPDIFCAVANFTAGLTCGDLLDRYTCARPYHAMLARGADYFSDTYKLLFRSTTPQEDHLEYFLADDALFDQAGISSLPCYHRVLYPERTAKWNSWRMGLRDYAKLLFRW